MCVCIRLELINFFLVVLIIKTKIFCVIFFSVCVWMNDQFLMKEIISEDDDDVALDFFFGKKPSR